MDGFFHDIDARHIHRYFYDEDAGIRSTTADAQYRRSCRRHLLIFVQFLALTVDNVITAIHDALPALDSLLVVVTCLKDVS